MNTLSLIRGEVHLWHLPLGGEPDLRVLSPDEHARAERFHRPADRRRFRNGRARLRDVLSRYTGSAELCFGAGIHGKPELTGAHAWLRFNLSHSADRMLLAVCREREVGVDLEALRDDFDFAAIAAEHFPHESSRELGADRFFALWTVTEARLKARGTGFLEAEPAHERARWHAQPLPAPAGFAAALAVEGPAPQLRCCTWLN